MSVDDTGEWFEIEKPCPFCGNFRDVELYPHKNSSQLTIVCNARKNGCGATCGYVASEKEAIQRWNSRFVVSTQQN